MLKLEDCQKHRALRYLVLVEGKRTITPVIYETRQAYGGPGNAPRIKRYQKRAFLTPIQRNELICPEDREKQLSNLDHYRKIVLQHTTEELNILSKIERRQQVRDDTGKFVKKE